MKITIQFNKHAFEAEIFDTPTANALLEATPFQSTVNTWGDEIYFSTPVQVGLEPDAIAEVEVGDLAYYPPLNAFCIFFGPTPMSYNEQPVAASAVNVFGKLSKVDLLKLRSVKDGEKVRIENV